MQNEDASIIEDRIETYWDIKNGSPYAWGMPVDYFRGSDAGNACIRSMTFNAAGFPTMFPARTQEIFAIGNMIEDKNIKAIGTELLLAAQPSANYTKPPIRGKGDAIVRGVNFKLLAELKSINSFGFRLLPEENDDYVLAGESGLMKFNKRYVCQWNTYAWSPTINLEHGFFWFESKDTQEHRFVWLKRDKQLHNEVMERHYEAAKYLPNIAPVPKQFNPYGCDECIDCPKRYLCRRLDPGEVTIEEANRVDFLIKAGDHGNS